MFTNANQEQQDSDMNLDVANTENFYLYNYYRLYIHVMN